MPYDLEIAEDVYPYFARRNLSARGWDIVAAMVNRPHGLSASALTIARKSRPAGRVTKIASATPTRLAPRLDYRCAILKKEQASAIPRSTRSRPGVRNAD